MVEGALIFIVGLIVGLVLAAVVRGWHNPDAVTEPTTSPSTSTRAEFTRCATARISFD